MRNTEKETKNKLEQLSLSIGEIDINKEDRESFDDKREYKKVRYIYSSSFKTSEIILLLILTSIVSVCMGGLVVYKVVANGGKYLDKELQSIIKNYQYIVDNYYDKVDKNKLVDSAIEGMLSDLDKNSTFVGSQDDDANIELEGNYKGIGVQVYSDENQNLVVYSVFDGSPADKVGLKAGDVLLKVNDESLEGKTPTESSEIIKSQKGEFTIIYKRDDKEDKVKINLSKVDLPSVVSKIIEKDDKKIGYIYTSIFAENTHSQFKKKLSKLEKEDMDGLIIDLRQNSGGYLSTAEDVLSLFLDSTHPIYQIKGRKNIKYYSKGKKDKKYKVVMLVDGQSASASELTTSAMKEQYGATVVGLKTYGKGTVQEIQTLPSGNQYKLTTKTWLTSKGNEVNGKGIEPDIEVALDENYQNDPKEENDNQLQKAIEEILK